MEIRRTVRIKNLLGLHARASAKLVKVVENYHSEIYIKKGDHEVDGSSILTILTLAGTRGSKLEFRAVGDDAEELLDAIEELFEQRFGEDE
jgi:phosphotransferase system HPr (HPr) family protein